MTGVQITLSGASLEELFATMREMLPESEAPAQEPEKPKRGKGKGKAAAAKDEAGAEAVEEAEAGDEPFGDDDTVKDDLDRDAEGDDLDVGAHTEKLSPQPQRPVSFGLRKTKPDCSVVSS